MGEIADMMLDGTLCEGCGVFLDGDGVGFPRYCASCEKDQEEMEPPKPSHSELRRTLVVCPLCKKKVTAVGIADHLVAKHGA